MLITFDRDKATFVSLNRFEAKKNIELALEAFSVVKKDRPDGSMRLVVAGMSILHTTTSDNSTDVPFVITIQEDTIKP